MIGDFRGFSDNRLFNSMTGGAMMDFQFNDRRTPISAPALGLLAGGLMILLLLAAATAKAVEVLTAQELASHCELLESEPDGADAQYCIRYIQGFIDGAVATDINVMLNAESGSDGNESFTERAMRTRLPSRASQYRASKLAGFCLGEPLPLRDVVNVVVADLLTLPNEPERKGQARRAVYASLQLHYPCGP